MFLDLTRHDRPVDRNAQLGSGMGASAAWVVRLARLAPDSLGPARTFANLRLEANGKPAKAVGRDLPGRTWLS